MASVADNFCLDGACKNLILQNWETGSSRCCPWFSSHARNLILRSSMSHSDGWESSLDRKVLAPWRYWKLLVWHANWNRNAAKDQKTILHMDRSKQYQLPRGLSIVVQSGLLDGQDRFSKLKHPSPQLMHVWVHCDAIWCCQWSYPKSNAIKNHIQSLEDREDNQASTHWAPWRRKLKEPVS